MQYPVILVCVIKEPDCNVDHDISWVFSTYVTDEYHCSKWSCTSKKVAQLASITVVEIASIKNNCQVYHISDIA